MFYNCYICNLYQYKVICSGWPTPRKKRENLVQKQNQKGAPTYTELYL